MIRGAFSAAFVIGLTVHASAAALDKRFQLALEDTKPAARVPSVQPAPDIEVIKPKTDPDPKIEKNPPNPDPDPAGKDVIKPPSSIEPK